MLKKVEQIGEEYRVISDSCDERLTTGVCSADMEQISVEEALFGTETEWAEQAVLYPDALKIFDNETYAEE